MSVLTPEACAALDRMDQIAEVWKTIGNLTTPSNDLDTVNRDTLASSLYFLQQEYTAARNAFTQASHQVQP